MAAHDTAWHWNPRRWPLPALPSLVVRARREPEFVLVRRDKVPNAVLTQLEQTPGISVQSLTRTWPDGRCEEALRLPVEIARSFLGAEAPAAV